MDIKIIQKSNLKNLCVISFLYDGTNYYGVASLDFS